MSLHVEHNNWPCTSLLLQYIELLYFVCHNLLNVDVIVSGLENNSGQVKF